MYRERVISLIICLSMLFTLCGCASNFRMNDVPETSAILPSVVSSEENPAQTVVDASGRSLAVPEHDNVTIASVYAVAVPFIVALELSENVAAINYKSKFWPDNVPGLAQAGSVGRGLVDLEKLADYHPDVLIHRVRDTKTIDAVETLDIPVMTISAENIDEIFYSIDLIGRYCHAEQRAGEVKKWMNGKFEKIARIVNEIPEAEKPGAVVFGGELGVIAGGDMLQSMMLEKAGAVSLTSEMSGGNTGGEIASAWANIGVEKIFEMDPDVIFCTSSFPLDYTIDEILENPVWSELKAVKSGQVWIIPAKLDSWDLPGVSCPLGIMWMLHKMYPGHLSAEELKAEIDDYYMFMFGKTFDLDYLGYDLDA